MNKHILIGISILFVVGIVAYFLFNGGVITGNLVAGQDDTPWDDFRDWCCTPTEICGDGIDNNCNDFCDEPGATCTDGSMSGDVACCPQPANPCEMAVLHYAEGVTPGAGGGTCSVARVPDCRRCATATDCFDGDDETNDVCVAGRCVYTGGTSGVEPRADIAPADFAVQKKVGAVPKTAAAAGTSTYSKK